MFYAYILQSLSAPTQFYRGHITDLKQRLAEHNAGKCMHTSKFAPWRIKFYAAFDHLELAQNFERYPKSGSDRRVAPGTGAGNPQRRSQAPLSKRISARSLTSPSYSQTTCSPLS